MGLCLVYPDADCSMNVSSWLSVCRGDQVLERLLAEGTFDCQELNMPSTIEDICMGYSASISHQLLVRIEDLEHQVCDQNSLHKLKRKSGNRGTGAG